jgi:DNA (cytosine-5)-methyltransferase 1
VSEFEVVEICAGAGGQALGLERAGFGHALAVELDASAANTLRHNRSWKVAEGDVADQNVWDPSAYEGVTLLAGGVPCPPFSIAGKQLGASDERDLFAWAVETCRVVKPRALMLENVKGLAANRFAAYRQRVLDELAEQGYVADWDLLQANEFGVPQLRPRFVLVAMKPEDWAYFRWPEAQPTKETVGSTLVDLMGANGWGGAQDWAEKRANKIAPTIVGGSKKHGGADLGPTRAKAAWRAMGVDGLGLANEAPGPEMPLDFVPKLTVDMVARIQGWRDQFGWEFTGLKTSRYRQVGNAFPPPVAEAVGRRVVAALRHEGEPRELTELAEPTAHDEVYRVLRNADKHISAEQIIKRLEGNYDLSKLERRLAQISRDFELDIKATSRGSSYRLGDFKGFVGQEGHHRHEYMAKHRGRVS